MWYVGVILSFFVFLGQAEILFGYHNSVATRLFLK